ncbi:MAG: hypothetical protein AAGA18_01240 [Verrucomicrobiota bacterium]
MPHLMGWLSKLLVAVSPLLLWACESQQSTGEKGSPVTKAHYVEFVSASVEKQCNILEQVHGVSFGTEVEDLGRAKIAKTGDGTFIGVRAPLAEHEQPIVRVYFAVEDITKAVKEAEAAGAVIAYPPTKQGETGTWAIIIQDEIQHGLWQP